MAVNYPPHNPELPVVLVDFDGTLATNTWPSPRLGKPDQAAIELVYHYAAKGCEVQVFTARPPSHFPRIWRWLEDNGLYDCIYDVSNVKRQACLMFDDRAYNWGDIKRGI